MGKRRTMLDSAQATSNIMDALRMGTSGGVDRLTENEMIQQAMSTTNLYGMGFDANAVAMSDQLQVDVTKLASEGVTARNSVFRESLKAIRKKQAEGAFSMDDWTDLFGKIEGFRLEDQKMAATQNRHDAEMASATAKLVATKQAQEDARQQRMFEHTSAIIEKGFKHSDRFKVDNLPSNVIDFGDVSLMPAINSVMKSVAHLTNRMQYEDGQEEREAATEEAKQKATAAKVGPAVADPEATLASVEEEKQDFAYGIAHDAETARLSEAAQLADSAAQDEMDFENQPPDPEPPAPAVPRPLTEIEKARKTLADIQSFPTQVAEAATETGEDIVEFGANAIDVASEEHQAIEDVAVQEIIKVQKSNLPQAQKEKEYKKIARNKWFAQVWGTSKAFVGAIAPGLGGIMPDAEPEGPARGVRKLLGDIGVDITEDLIDADVSLPLHPSRKQGDEIRTSTAQLSDTVRRSRSHGRKESLQRLIDDDLLPATALALDGKGKTVDRDKMVWMKLSTSLREQSGRAWKEDEAGKGGPHGIEFRKLRRIEHTMRLLEAMGMNPQPTKKAETEAERRKRLGFDQDFIRNLNTATPPLSPSTLRIQSFAPPVPGLNPATTERSTTPARFMERAITARTIEPHSGTGHLGQRSTYVDSSGDVWILNPDGTVTPPKKR